MTLGILIPDRVRESLRGNDGDPHRELFADQSKRYGIELAVTGPSDINIAAGRARLLVPTDRGWRETSGDLPAMFSNQLARPGATEARALRDLNGLLGTIVFNESNRLRLPAVYDMLASLSETRNLVPRTSTIEPRQLAGKRGVFLVAPLQARHEEFIFDCTGDGVAVHQVSAGTGARTSMKRELLADLLWPAQGSGRIWIRELPGWPVGTGAATDWRFYVQRGRAGEWTVAAAVGKSTTGPQAKPVAWRLPDALKVSFGSGGPAIEERLTAAALSAASGLAKFLPGLVHCSFDFWVSTDGAAWLRAVSGLPDPAWLQRSGDSDGLRRVVDHPVVFARTLAQKGVAKLNVDFGRAGQGAGM